MSLDLKYFQPIRVYGNWLKFVLDGIISDWDVAVSQTEIVLTKHHNRTNIKRRVEAVVDYGAQFFFSLTGKAMVQKYTGPLEPYTITIQATKNNLRFLLYEKSNDRTLSISVEAVVKSLPDFVHYVAEYNTLAIRAGRSLVIAANGDHLVARLID